MDRHSFACWTGIFQGLRADPSASLATLGDLYGGAVRDAQAQGETAIKVSEVHPLVWTHPSTGRKAIISACMWMYRIVEADGTPWTAEASHAYLHQLLAPVDDECYTHPWRADDLVCFDNRSVMHSAAGVPPDASKDRFRLLHQIILCGNQVSAFLSLCLSVPLSISLSLSLFRCLCLSLPPSPSPSPLRRQNVAYALLCTA